MSAERNLDLASRWLAQAAYDLELAEFTRSKYAFGACFHAQQAAEKAVKAVLYLRNGETRRTHSLLALLKEAPELAELVSAKDAKALDFLYLPSRYPDALLEGIPAEALTEEDAEAAVNRARKIVGSCGQIVAAVERQEKS